MSIREGMRAGYQLIRNEERLSDWRFKLDCLKRNNGHLVPSIFTAENSHVYGVRIVK